MANSPIMEERLIYQEMMTHPVLFTHHNPQKIAIVGDDSETIMAEALKHKASDRIAGFLNNHTDWMTTSMAEEWDVLIITAQPVTEYFSEYFRILHKRGIVLQQCDTPFQLEPLRQLCETFRAKGFRDVQPLHFPHPGSASGFCSAVMAIKEGVLRRPREKDIFNKTFDTHYYNLDVHKAALALPEFMRKELTLET